MNLAPLLMNTINLRNTIENEIRIRICALPVTSHEFRNTLYDMTDAWMLSQIVCTWKQSNIVYQKRHNKTLIFSREILI